MTRNVYCTMKTTTNYSIKTWLYNSIKKPKIKNTPWNNKMLFSVTSLELILYQSIQFPKAYLKKVLPLGGNTAGANLVLYRTELLCPHFLHQTCLRMWQNQKGISPQRETPKARKAWTMASVHNHFLPWGNLMEASVEVTDVGGDFSSAFAVFFPIVQSEPMKKSMSVTETNGWNPVCAGVV